MNNSQKNIYASWHICQYEINENVPQKQEISNDLGKSTSFFLNIYLPANSAFVSAGYDAIYPNKNRPFYKPNVPTVTLGINYGIIAFLYKKAEGKSNERAAGEAVVETTLSYFGGKLGERIAIALAGRVAGAAAGAAVGSTFPIVGTVIGAVIGGIAVSVSDAYKDSIFSYIEELFESEEDKKQRLENERIQKLTEILNHKINQINNYLITHKYIELRELNENEAQELCEEASNPNHFYFRTIAFMLSYPNYLDRDKEEYKKAQEKNPTLIRVEPIANAIAIKVEIEKCFNSKSGELLKNKELYVYSHRFERIVAKAKTDNKGRVVFDKVFVGKQSSIDKISFVVDRENFNEENFDESVSQYAPIFNVQNIHKQKKEALIHERYFSFGTIQKSIKDNEVIKLNAKKTASKVIFDYSVLKEEGTYKPYIIFAYLVFDIKENIEEYVKNITVEDRAYRGLEYLGSGLNTEYPIKEEWKEKGVVFFAYFNSQKFTPYAKISFVDKPIVILDAGHGGKDSGAISPNFNNDKIKESEIVAGIVKLLNIQLSGLKQKINVVLTRTEDKKIELDDRVNLAENIYALTQSKKMLFLSFHVNSGNPNAKGIECYYNQDNYAKYEEKFIDILESIIDMHKEVLISKRKNFKNIANFRVNKNIKNMPSILIECGFITNTQERQSLNTIEYKTKIAHLVYTAIREYFKEELQ